MLSLRTMSRLWTTVFVVIFSASSLLAAPKSKPIEVPDQPGVYRKVIIARDGLYLRRTPEQSGEKTYDAPASSIFFQLYTPDEKESDNGWIRLGGQDGTVHGWMEEAPQDAGNQSDPVYNVYHWNTRYLLNPRAEQNGNFFEVTVPGLQKPARFINVSGAITVPILEAPVTKDGRDDYAVAFYTGKSAVVKTGGVTGSESRQTHSTGLEIVFVIDSTGSMTPLIDGTKQVAAEIARQLQSNPELNRVVKFGLVEYRDDTDAILLTDETGKRGVSRLVMPLGPVSGLQSALGRVVAATETSEEVEEDVLAGLSHAIRDSGWSDNSSKHIILLGDASAHLRDSPKSTTGFEIDDVLNLAQITGDTQADKRLETRYLHCVRAIQPFADVAENARCADQYRRIAANRERFQGFYDELNPNDSGDRDRIVKEILDFISKAIRGTAALRKGDVAMLEQLASAKTENNQIAQTLWQVEQAVNGKPLPAVIRGQAFDRSSDGELLATRQVMISRDDLRRLRSTLDLLLLILSDKVDPTQRGDVGKLLKTIQESVAASVTGQSLDAETPLESMIGNLPLRTGVLRTSLEALAALTEKDFRKWLETLEVARDRADHLLSDPDRNWGDLSPVTSNQEFTYIDLDQLP